jgi:hypothetical protein
LRRKKRSRRLLVEVAYLVKWRMLSKVRYSEKWKHLEEIPKSHQGKTHLKNWKRKRFR